MSRTFQTQIAYIVTSSAPDNPRINILTGMADCLRRAHRGGHRVIIVQTPQRGACHLNQAETKCITEIESFFKDNHKHHHKVIVALIMTEILDKQIAMKLA